ncbi:hypothetical protein [Francisella sp. 19X1-34]|uniref:hypothetical protein n=1 Tax=Francisella sp. 19X1-34 TaxID=3087177 RepID=UPI002E343BA6|nr:hypothetical protein [Francisella sp. 19X1-34]MED7787867.1 hypothetical protein [Francisella sp. 19X1-34]
MLEFRVKASENQKLRMMLENIEINPYSHFIDFKNEIANIVNREEIADNLFNFIEETKSVEPIEQPLIFIENLPIDNDLPIFSNTNPVEEKRYLKKNFVAEGVLTLYALLRDEKPIGYMNVNDGDVFQDIYPKEDLFSSQSQKALNDIYFHKDLANHYVRPDTVNILCLRNSVQNHTVTSFSRNVDVLNELSEYDKDILSKKIFNTPFDDLSTYKSNVPLGKSDIHNILDKESLDIKFFENRTTSDDKDGREVIRKLIKALHKVKINIHLRPGDLIGSANNFSVHCKSILSISNPDMLKQRWLMKTVNVDDYDKHKKYHYNNIQHLIAG